MNSKVSIVIPVYNAERTIKDAIQAILNQDYPQECLELLLIDDGSTDKSANIIEEFLKSTTPTPIRYIQQAHSGPAIARNKGWKEATGDIICFTDADCLPSRDWVTRLINGFKSGDIGAVSGSYDVVNKENPLARCIWREIRYRHSLMSDFPRSFGSYNFSVRREVLENVGGFNESYTSASGEDNDLAYKILKAGFKIYFEKSAIVKHYFPEKLSRYLDEQYQHGFWRMKLYRSHPKMVSGDDYTRLKDALEPALISLIFLLAIYNWINTRVWPLFFGLVIFYITLQFMVAVKICFRDKTFRYLYLAYITFLRGLARTIGMWKGIFSS